MKHLLITTIAAVVLVGCGGPPKNIHQAAEQGDIEAVKQYLADGVDVNVKEGGFADGTPLHEAANWGHMEIVELLIAKGADVNAKTGPAAWTPLHVAANADRKEVAELLIAEGAGVNTKTDDGWTPLQFAAKSGHKEVAELLIAEGADVNAKIRGGWTVLDEVTHPDNPNKNKAQITDLIRKHGGKTRRELKAAGN